jgi:cytoplasmic tRNA 2-thiolation protein 1
MPPRLCQLCQTNKALIRRPKTGQQVCKPCFFEVFETEVHHTITENGGIFKPGDKVAIGASGGKGEPDNGGLLMLERANADSVSIHSF